MNDDPITPLYPTDAATGTAVQAGLDDLQGIRDRLRGNIRALTAGQLSRPQWAIEPDAVQLLRERMAADEARRGEAVVGTIDAAFESLHHQVVGDIVNAADTIARLEQFNARSAPAAGDRAPARRTASRSDVIDVQLTEPTPPIDR